MVGRVELGLEASSFSTQCFVLHCFGVNARSTGASVKKRLELTITTSSRSHSRARSLSQLSIPVLLSLSFTCLLSSPIGSALCRRPFLVTQTRPYLRLLAQSTNSGGESRNTAGLPNFFAEAIVSTGNPIVRKRLTLYDGTIGAHGMHALHSLTGRESPPDGNAYMISAPDNGDDAGS